MAFTSVKTIGNHADRLNPMSLMNRLDPNNYLRLTYLSIGVTSSACANRNNLLVTSCMFKKVFFVSSQ